MKQESTTEKAGFTPGPWRVDGPPWNQIVWSDHENRICFLAHSNGLDDERDLATGRLIAAAPDMFAALSAMLSVGDKIAREQARAALSKAKGASS
jgi:hypothetical protein